MFALKKNLLVYGPYAVIAIWTAVAVYLSRANPTVGLSDMFIFIERAEHISSSSLRTWVDGLYPVGYPFALWSLSTLVGDYEVAGRILALLSGVLGLGAIVLLTRILFGPSVALLAVALCSTNPMYMKYATTSGTDMPALAFLLSGLYLACRYNVTERRMNLLGAGVLIGVAYLIRYTAVTAVIAIVFSLVDSATNSGPLGGKASRYHVVSTGLRRRRIAAASSVSARER